jgi:solute carrier family 50 protein (sugar transporter)
LIIYLTLQIYTAKLLIFFNIGLLGLIILSTSLIIRESYLRLTAVGWICAMFSVCVYAAPLSVMVIINSYSIYLYPNYSLFQAYISSSYSFSFFFFFLFSFYQKLVITTKSVEFMPLSLSFSLTICAIMWFFYGLLIKDFFVAVKFAIPSKL